MPTSNMADASHPVALTGEFRNNQKPTGKEIGMEKSPNANANKSHIIQEANTCTPPSLSIWIAFFVISFAFLMTGIILVGVGFGTSGDTALTGRGFMKYGGIILVVIGAICCVLSATFYVISHQRNSRNNLLDGNMNRWNNDDPEGQIPGEGQARTRDPSDVMNRSTSHEAEVRGKSERQQEVFTMFRASSFSEDNVQDM